MGEFKLDIADQRNRIDARSQWRLQEQVKGEVLAREAAFRFLCLFGAVDPLEVEHNKDSLIHEMEKEIDKLMTGPGCFAVLRFVDSPSSNSPIEVARRIAEVDSRHVDILSELHTGDSEKRKEYEEMLRRMVGDPRIQRDIRVAFPVTRVYRQSGREFQSLDKRTRIIMGLNKTALNTFLAEEIIDPFCIPDNSGYKVNVFFPVLHLLQNKVARCHCSDCFIVNKESNGEWFKKAEELFEMEKKFQNSDDTQPIELVFLRKLRELLPDVLRDNLMSLALVGRIQPFLPKFIAPGTISSEYSVLVAEGSGLERLRDYREEVNDFVEYTARLYEIAGLSEHVVKIREAHKLQKEIVIVAYDSGFPSLWEAGASFKKGKDSQLAGKSSIALEMKLHPDKSRVSLWTGKGRTKDRSWPSGTDAWTLSGLFRNRKPTSFLTDTARTLRHLEEGARIANGVSREKYDFKKNPYGIPDNFWKSWAEENLREGKP